MKPFEFCFYLQPNKSEKNWCPEMVLYRTFLAPWFCTVLINQNEFFQRRKKAFLGYVDLYENKQIPKNIL